MNRSQPQRGYGFQPRVAGVKRRLPWDATRKMFQPQRGCVRAVLSLAHGRNTFGVVVFRAEYPGVGYALLRQPRAYIRKPVGLVSREAFLEYDLVGKRHPFSDFYVLYPSV